MRIAKGTFLLLGAMALAAAALAADAPPAAATAPAPAIADLPIRIGGHVRVLAPLLTHETSAPQARQELLALQESFFSTLGSFADDEDLELRLRTLASLEDGILEVRVARILAILPLEQADKMLRFRKAQPRLFAEMFSQDWSRRTKAMKQLAKATDPQKLAEPLVIMSLRHPDSQLVAQAALAAGRLGYDSPAITEALIEVALQDDNDNGYLVDPDGTRTSSWMAALSALRDINSAQAAPVLASLLISNKSNWGNYERYASVAEALANSNEIRVLPALIASLDNRRTANYSWSNGDSSGGTSLCDYAFYAVLRLTGQAGQEYAFIVNSNYGNTNMGFSDEKSRRVAYDRVKQWWAAHKDEPPYKTMEPLEIKPMSRPGNKAATASSAPATMAASAPAPASMPAPVLPPSLAASVAEYLRPLARQCAAPNLHVRQAAQRAIADLEDVYLQSLVEAAREGEPALRDKVLDLLAEAFAEGTIQSTLCRLPAAQKAKMFALLQDSPKAARDMFSLNSSAKAEAMKTLLARPDPNTLAEPLLLLTLKDPAPFVQRFGISLAATGRYRSDESIDALLCMLLAISQDEWNQAAYNSDRPLRKLLEALTKIGSPRAAPVLLGMLNVNEYNRAALLIEPLVATGQKGMIPALIGRLNNTSVYSTHSMNNKSVTLASSDTALVVLLRLTGQDIKSYGLESIDSGVKLYGFKDEKTRKDAIKKFRDWWAANKDQAPYKDIKPIGAQTLTGADGRQQGD